MFGLRIPGSVAGRLRTEVCRCSLCVGDFIGLWCAGTRIQGDSSEYDVKDKL